MSSWEPVVDRITTFIKSKVEDANAQGVVMGLSGGVDSACTACLSQKALTPPRVLAIIAPEEGVTPPQDVEDAVNLCKDLKIDYKVIKINSLVNAFIQAIGEEGEIATANLKPRIRMAMLYFFANNKNMLVAGGGNKTELKVGYFTKYGDGGVDILPLGDLYKTEVFSLAEYLEVPRKIIDKKPTAGLWRGQTDESEIGMSYDKLDTVLKAIEEGREANVNGVERADVDKVKSMIEGSAHKREMPSIAEVRDLLSG